MNRKALLEQKQHHIKAARDLAAKAEAQRRDFTAGERAAVKSHVDAARDSALAIAELDGDQKLIDELNFLGAPGGDGRTRGGSKNYRGSGLNVAGRIDFAGIGDAFDTAKKARTSGSKALLEVGSIGVAIPTLSDQVARIAERPTRVLDLVQVAPASDDRFRYFRQTTRTNLAAAVAVGATKPTSVFTVEDVDDRTRTFAHLSEPIPRQWLDDSGMLRTFVEQELRSGVLEAIEDAVVAGSGIGEDPEGLLVVAGTQAQAWDTSLLVTTRKAKNKLEVENLVPTAFLFHPTDWMAMELLRTESGGAGTGGFLLETGPVDVAAQRLWGVPVVTSTAIPVGTGVVADLGDVVLVMREDVRVDVSENVDDDFIKNQVRIRAEARAGIAYLRPLSTVEIDLTAA